MPELFGYRFSRTQQWLIPMLATIVITLIAAIPAYVELFADKEIEVDAALPQSLTSEPDPRPVPLAWQRSGGIRALPPTAFQRSARPVRRLSRVAIPGAPVEASPGAEPARLTPIYQPPAETEIATRPPSPQTDDILPAIHDKTAPEGTAAPIISPPRDRTAETIVVPRMKLAPDMLHTLCAGRLPLEYRFSVFNPLAVKLALPLERDLEINEVLPFEGCKVTFLGVEQEAKRRAVFRVEWKE